MRHAIKKNVREGGGRMAGEEVEDGGRRGGEEGRVYVLAT